MFLRNDLSGDFSDLGELGKKSSVRNGNSR